MKNKIREKIVASVMLSAFVTPLFFSIGKASQLYSHNLPGLFDYARQMQKLPVSIPAHKLPDRILPR